MARVKIEHDTDPALHIVLDETDDPEPSWDGPCAGCGWTPSEGGARFNNLTEAVQAAIVHLDYQH